MAKGKRKKPVDVELTCWVPLRLSLTADQVRYLDAHARAHWEIGDDEGLAAAEILVQAAREGLVDLPNDFHTDDDYELGDGDLTRSQLLEMIAD